MTVGQSHDRRPPNQVPKRPAPLPLRWLVIMGLGAAVGITVGKAEGLPAGVLVSLFTAGGLHKIVS
jgi:hypothetical protein